MSLYGEAVTSAGVEWLKACVRYLKMDIEIVGKENLPAADDGRLYTFVSNHPLGGQDGVALGAVIGRHYDGRFRYLVNDLLMNLPGLAPVCIGINKTGRNGRNFPAMVEAGFKSDNHMLDVPRRTQQPKAEGRVIHDIPWKKTFITKSVEYQRDVVPIHFSGTNSKRFYRIAKFSDRFLPFNLAMLFLVDEMYKNVGKHFRHRHRQANPVADLRPQPHAGTVGCMRGGHRLRPAQDQRRRSLTPTRTRHTPPNKDNEQPFRNIAIQLPERHIHRRIREIMEEPIIQPVSKEILKSELTPERQLRMTNKSHNEIYIITAHNAPNVMREIGRLREIAFREAGGGTGKSMDIDEYDTCENCYKQLIVWNPEAEEIIGGYRYLLGSDWQLDENGQPLLATSHMFHFSDTFLRDYMPYTVELGRSFVTRCCRFRL